MALVKLIEAARLAGVSRSTMDRALKSGRVSFETDTRGNRWVDPSEVARVYGSSVRTVPEVVPEPSQVTVPRSSRRPSQAPSSQRQLDDPLVQQLLARIEARIEAQEQTIRDLRQRLDREGEERRALNQQLLTSRRPWWRRWR